LPRKPKKKEFGLVLINSGKVVGAAKLGYDDEAKRFRVDAIVDAGCKPVRWTANDVPGANPASVSDVSHLRSTFGDDEYDIELKPNNTVVEMELHVVPA